MNLLHLKYAVEVAKTSSITKAAENLYMGQPNLSRAIKELEEDLGIKLFRRTSKGITPTAQGETFLGYARSILKQVEAVERMYKEDRAGAQRFSISVPRASYIACAFTDFVKTLDLSQSLELLYKETNALRAVNNILEANYHLGILRYPSCYERYFKKMLEEKGLVSELIYEFEHVALLSRDCPLAAKERFDSNDLSDMVEIALGDPFVPSVPVDEARREELSALVNKHIFLFERGSQFDLLSQIPNAFMWVSPVPQRLLERFGLVTKRCEGVQKLTRDVLIYKKEYHLTDEDGRFIDQLMKYVREIR